jgi:hypothetical protein
MRHPEAPRFHQRGEGIWRGSVYAILAVAQRFSAANKGSSYFNWGLSLHARRLSTSHVGTAAEACPERTASRRRPAFSSHLFTTVTLNFQERQWESLIAKTTNLTNLISPDGEDSRIAYAG